ncbi:MAG: hypothetical protein KDA80_02440, partial [Planctomycetaceae bacterium]|nr:hypothetical protein [Planctomycetaceae bacterium]
KEFDRFHHLYGEFYIDIPKDEGWVIEESPNKPGVPEWIKMENGPVRIEVRFDDSGTLVANATEGGMNIVEASQNFAAMGGRTMERNNSDPAIVRSLHDSAAKKYVNYRNFDDGPTKDFDMPYGDARISTCSFTEGIASNMKAIRISVYNSAKAWSIFCVAPEASFDQLKPTFERIVQSMEGVQPKFD